MSDPSHRRANGLTRRRWAVVPQLTIGLAFGLMLVTITSPAGAQTSDDVEHAKSDRDAAFESVTRVQEQVEAALIEYDRAHTELRGCRGED